MKKNILVTLILALTVCIAVGCGRKKEDNEKADLDVFLRAIKINPNNDFAHNGLGIEYGRLGENHKAIAAFKRAIELNPNEASYYDNIGVSYGKQRKIRSCH